MATFDDFMKGYFTLSNNENEIHCRISFNGQEDADIKNVIICCHGFVGSKDSLSIEALSEKVLKEKKDAIVISFDWPCHGDDTCEALTLEKCDEYLSAVIKFAIEKYRPRNLLASGVSFGGYLLLKYVAEYGNPFNRVAVRSAAVTMYDILFNTIMSKEERQGIKEGKTIMVGFDVKAPVTEKFLKELSASDIMRYSFDNYKSDILMIHGTDDEVVPFAAADLFSRRNNICLITVEGADHRFLDDSHMREAINQMYVFLLV